LAWREARELFGTSTVIADIIGIVAVIIFIALSIGYISKWVLYSQKVKAEFTHPVVGNFFGTITIAILLLSSVIGIYSQISGQLIWIIGTVSALALCFVFVTRLLNGNHEPVNKVPASLVPVVGTLDISVAGGQCRSHGRMKLICFQSPFPRPF
jgi:tellurite resistance protein